MCKLARERQRYLLQACRERLLSIGQSVKALMLDMAKLQICGDRLKKCLETDTPIHAFVPKPVPYSGPYVTTEMRERWAKLDHDFAMLRTITSLIYTEEGMVEVVKATQDKLEIIEAVLVEKDLSENSKSTLKRTWDEYQTQTQGQVEELLSRKRSRVGEMSEFLTTQIVLNSIFPFPSSRETLDNIWRDYRYDCR